MPSMPMVGSELAGYRLRAVLGRGGMSVVFEAENPRLGSTVALKVLAPDIAANDIFRARFLQESRIAAALNHPNVVPIYDVGPCDDLLYIAMRYVAGSDLRAVLRSQRLVSPAQALFLTGQAARALDVAHHRGLVHRDVKPGNILIERGYDEDDPDHVYLADFGIAKHMMSQSGLTATGEFVGTIDYIAPEQIQDKPVDGSADEYSLACVLYECLTGRVPFVKGVDAAVIWAHVEEQPAPPSSIRPELPRAIDDVIARALAKNPGERFSSCRDFISAASAALVPVAGEPETVLSHRGESGGGHQRANNSAPRGPGRAGASGPSHRVPPPGGGSSGDTQLPGAARPGRRRAALLGALALVIVVAVGAWALLHGGTGGASPAAGKPAAPATAPHMSNEIIQAISRVAPKWLKPSTCSIHSPSMVTCPHPSASVQNVTFRTYPTLAALYSAYETQVKMLSGGTFRINFQDCNEAQSNGEASWNHLHKHPMHYTLKDLSSPAWNSTHANDAAGRMYCTTVSGSKYYLVWTQNGSGKTGNMLGVLYGGPHPKAWYWWEQVHHDIYFAGASMPGM